MTWNRHGDLVGAAGESHRPDRFGRSNALGNLGVTGRFPCGDFTQCLPDTFLEGGAAHVQRQVQANGWRFDETDDLCDQQLEVLITTNKVRFTEHILEVTHQRIRIIAKKNRANTALALSYENGTQGTLT